MPIEILMPALSPTMEDGTLAKWLVKEGDTVASGDLIAEIETDKATMEFEAVDEGVVGKILVAEGREGVLVNTPIMVLLEDGESADDISSTPAAPPASTATPAAAPVSQTTPDPAKRIAPVTTQATEIKRIFASPLARRIAVDAGVDLAQITGSGPHGRIVKADVLGNPASVSAPTTAPMPTGPASDALAKIYADREYEVIALNGMRKTIAARLTEAKQSIPHFYLRRDIRIDALLAGRAHINKQLESRGLRVSVNDFIIKACAMALQTVPAANAIWAGDRLFQMKPSDVAVAVSVEDGLFTPVIKDAETKSLSQLSVEMKDLASRARNKKLAPHEYLGGSFAISNLGMFGIDNFDAVINPPHGAILAVGAGMKKPVVGKDGELSIATVMSVTLSVDHRVIDGALGALLLNAIVDNLENPIAMLA
ncbi:MAG: pyruvate dehydrogenase complex dihydrolipoamide acetyltransferase [Marinosulfonomonas sp.]|nr:pyruvate dehydrogenase complex dihydrolipoamide acetyltransferase [Marinosulfonomonas sp.]